jgi:hypothetical protein
MLRVCVWGGQRERRGGGGVFVVLARADRLSGHRHDAVG